MDLSTSTNDSLIGFPTSSVNNSANSWRFSRNLSTTLNNLFEILNADISVNADLASFAASIAMSAICL